MIISNEKITKTNKQENKKETKKLDDTENDNDNYIRMIETGYFLNKLIVTSLES